MQFGRRMADGDFDCDTELCLTPGGRQRSNTASTRRLERCAAGDIAGGEKEREMTMLYGGQVRVSDVTEMQARAIICMARREMEEMNESTSILSSLVGSIQPYALPPPSFTEPSLSNPRLSMKRSLQRFLQKRKIRVSDSISRQPQKKENLYQEADLPSLP